MRPFFTPKNVLSLLILCICSNCFAVIWRFPLALIVIIPLFTLLNVYAGRKIVCTESVRLKFCYHGVTMLNLFVHSLAFSVVFQSVFLVLMIKKDPWLVLWSILFCTAAEAIVFWHGIICVYCTSIQLGIRIRVIGIICGIIPIANFIALNKIISTVMDEVEFEADKENINALRKDEKVCETKYPILFIHGVFFRDSKYFNYWGRIPRELENNGARVYYGEHQSALSVEKSAEELAHRIKVLVHILGCEKVNIIAHSKGGIDCRYAISKLDSAQYVASLTTVNTPHRGCLFAEYLLEKIPGRIKGHIAKTYNSTLRELGDRNPDFLAAVNDLTATKCAEFDRELAVPDNIFRQSVGSKLNRATGGKFPLNFSYNLVKRFDGPNDGLVSENSFEWGDKYTLITVCGKRGVSHGDMVDLNRENLRGFDVREFYVELVRDLKQRGL